LAKSKIPPKHVGTRLDVFQFSQQWVYLEHLPGQFGEKPRILPQPGLGWNWETMAFQNWLRTAPINITWGTVISGRNNAIFQEWVVSRIDITSV
jgi:hypothetical protein